MNATELQLLCYDVHKENEKWWLSLDTGEPIDRPIGQMCMLMVSEVAEAMEGARKGLQDDKLPHRPMLEVEMADVVIRLADLAGALRLTLYTYDVALDSEDTGTNLLHICDDIIKFYREFDQIETVSIDTFRELSVIGHDMLCNAASAILARVSMFCFENGLDLWGAVEEKRAFNREREDHKVEARKLEGGKKW